MKRKVRENEGQKQRWCQQGQQESGMGRVKESRRGKKGGRERDRVC